MKTIRVASAILLGSIMMFAGQNVYARKCGGECFCETGSHVCCKEHASPGHACDCCENR